MIKRHTPRLQGGQETGDVVRCAVPDVFAAAHPHPQDQASARPDMLPHQVTG